MLIPTPKKFLLEDVVAFDGSTYLSYGSGLDGAADGKSGTLSVWLQTTTNRYIFNTETGVAGFEVFITGGKLRIIGRNAANATILSVTTAATVTDGNPHHIAIDFDLTSASNRGAYVDGASDSATWATYTNDTINYTGSNTYVGCDPSLANIFSGDMADLYLATSRVNLSANLDKFIKNGKRVSLGGSGERPTGSQPILYLGREYDVWQDNIGSGGGFTENGTLTASATVMEV